jgi:hypothetical protein
VARSLLFSSGPYNFPRVFYLGSGDGRLLPGVRQTNLQSFQHGTPYAHLLSRDIRLKYLRNFFIVMNMGRSCLAHKVVFSQSLPEETKIKVVRGPTLCGPPEDKRTKDPTRTTATGKAPPHLTHQLHGKDLKPTFPSF